MHLGYFSEILLSVKATAQLPPIIAPQAQCRQVFRFFSGKARTLEF